MSGVGDGMGVVDGDPCAPRRRGGFGGLCPYSPISVNGMFLYATSKF